MLPYATREVRFASGAASLAGTPPIPTRTPNTIPASSSCKAPRPICVASTGSTPITSRAPGSPVLVFDKRGKGDSSGDYGAATYDTLAGDAAAAVEFSSWPARRRPAARGRVGPEPGRLHRPVGRRPSTVAQVHRRRVRPGTTDWQSAAYQDSVRLTSAGFDEADVQRAVSLDHRLLTWLRTGREQTGLAASLAQAAETPWGRASSLPARLPTGAALEGVVLARSHTRSRALVAGLARARAGGVRGRGRARPREAERGVGRACTASGRQSRRHGARLPRSQPRDSHASTRGRRHVGLSARGTGLHGVGDALGLGALAARDSVTTISAGQVRPILLGSVFTMHHHGAGPRRPEIAPMRWVSFLVHLALSNSPIGGPYVHDTVVAERSRFRPAADASRRVATPVDRPRGPSAYEADDGASRRPPIDLNRAGACPNLGLDAVGHEWPRDRDGP